MNYSIQSTRVYPCHTPSVREFWSLVDPRSSQGCCPLDLPSSTALPSANPGWLVPHQSWAGPAERHPCDQNPSGRPAKTKTPDIIPQTLHVWYIYICLHWGGLRGQCRHIWRTWSVWVLELDGIPALKCRTERAFLDVLPEKRQPQQVFFVRGSRSFFLHVLAKTSSPSYHATRPQDFGCPGLYGEPNLAPQLGHWRRRKVLRLFLSFHCALQLFSSSSDPICIWSPGQSYFVGSGFPDYHQRLNPLKISDCSFPLQREHHVLCSPGSTTVDGESMLDMTYWPVTAIPISPARRFAPANFCDRHALP